MEKSNAQKYSSYPSQKCVWQLGPTPPMLLLCEHRVYQLRTRWNGEATPAVIRNFNPIPALLTLVRPPTSPACPAVNGIGCDLPALVWSAWLQLQMQSLMLWPRSQAGWPRHLWNHKWVFLLCTLHAKSLQLCPTHSNPMRYSPPGSSVHGILQARILVWVAMPSSKGIFLT